MQTATRQQMLDELFRDQLPRQGEWGAEEYLWLTDHTNRLIEFTDGYIEVLPMPTIKHQLIIRFFLLAFMAEVEPPGRVIFAALRLYLNDTTYREPDLLLLLDAEDPRNQDRYWHGADLVLEVVSEDDPARDLVVKRREYARAGIPEYWIVNPLDETITVLALRDGTYAEHGVFRRGQRATSALLPTFAVSVSEVFDAR
ncbi:MAG: Uma2 family endonuclease [Thermomicrobiales bacterium]